MFSNPVLKFCQLSNYMQSLHKIWRMKHFLSVAPAHFLKSKNFSTFSSCTFSNSISSTESQLLASKLKTVEQTSKAVQHTNEAEEHRKESLSIKASPDRKYVIIHEVNKEPVIFHSIWLRHNCHCLECKQPFTGQKLIEVYQLQPKYTIASTHLDMEGIVHITWNEEKHNSIIPLEFLKNNQYISAVLNQLKSNTEPSPCVDLPNIKYEDLVHDAGILKWMHLIDQYGSCLVKNVPTSVGMVQKMAEMIWPVQQTIYGHMWDVKSEPQPINIAYSNVKLDFHMDLAYYESPPGIQFLHCLEFDDYVEGGESLLVDAWYMAELLRATYPEDFEILTRVPATFQKIHLDRDHPVHMRYQRPHIAVTPSGRIVGVFWAPAFEGPLMVPDNQVEPYYKAYQRFAGMLQSSSTVIKLRLVPGDLLSFNNRRILHARTEYHLNGGQRHFQGCYLNIDEFKSSLEVLSQKLYQTISIKHVLNQSWG